MIEFSTTMITRFRLFCSYLNRFSIQYAYMAYLLQQDRARELVLDTEICTKFKFHFPLTNTRVIWLDIDDKCMRKRILFQHVTQLDQ